MSIHTERRTAFISGLRELAAFMEANPEVPAPADPTIITYFPSQKTDSGFRAEIDRIATLCGTTIDPRLLPLGHYTTVQRFGPIHFEATAVLTTTRGLTTETPR
ncbi:hypothetical protein [Streptosporangium sp. KLBMP 9127]|nr:hypothetical protein [Streptosporangium sp. KLBMP 9127]